MRMRTKQNRYGKRSLCLILLFALTGSAQNSVEHSTPSTTTTPNMRRSDTLTFIRYANRTLHADFEVLLHSVTSDFVAMHCGWDNKTLLINWAAPSKSIVSWHVKRDKVWEEGGLLERKRDEEEDMFGRSLSVDGEVVVVGAPHITEGGGSVYIFTATPLGWVEIQHIKLSTPHKSFGWQVSNAGEWLAISAPFGRHRNGRGCVYLYKETEGGSWGFHQVLRAAYDAQSFGAALSLTRNKLAVFAQVDSPLGAKPRDYNIHIYRYTDRFWLQEAVLTPMSEDYANPLFEDTMFSHKLHWQGDALIVAAFSSKKWTPLLHVYIETSSGWMLLKSFNYPFTSLDRLLWDIRTSEAQQDSIISSEASHELRHLRKDVAQSVCNYGLTVHSSGSGLGDRQTYIYLRGIDQLAAYGRGMNVATFNFSRLQSGATRTGVFDLFQNSSASQALIRFIEQSSDGVVFAFAVQDEGSNTVTSALRSAMSSHFGATLFSTLGYANSYILVGVKGQSRPASESVSATQSLTQTACLDNGVLVAINGASTLTPSQAPPGVTAVPTTLSSCSHALSTLSYGTVAGIGSSYIKLNGQNLLSTYGRGIDIVVLNLVSYAVVASESFDTFENSTASDRCASFIDGQSTGLLFVLVVQDEASNLLTTNLKHLVGIAFGAVQFASLGYGNSYVLIGVKGSSTPIYESLSATTTVQSVNCLTSGISGNPVPSSTPTSSSTLLPTATSVTKTIAPSVTKTIAPSVTTIAPSVTKTIAPSVTTIAPSVTTIAPSVTKTIAPSDALSISAFPSLSPTLQPSSSLTGAPSEITISPTNSHSISIAPSASPTVLAPSILPSLFFVPSISSNPVTPPFPSLPPSGGFTSWSPTGTPLIHSPAPTLVNSSLPLVSAHPSSFPSVVTSAVPSATPTLPSVSPSVAHSNSTNSPFPSSVPTYSTIYPSTVSFSSIIPTQTLSQSPSHTLSPPTTLPITPIPSASPSSSATVSPSAFIGTQLPSPGVSSSGSPPGLVRSPFPSGLSSVSPVVAITLSPSTSFSASPTPISSTSISPVPVSSPLSSTTSIPTSSPSSTPSSAVAFATGFQGSRPFITILVSGVWIGVLFAGIVMLVSRRGATVEIKKQSFDPAPATARVIAPFARAESELHNFMMEVIPAWMQGGEQLSTLSRFLLVTHSWLGLFFTSDLGGSRLVRHFGKMLDALTIMFTSSLMFYTLYPANGGCETKVTQLNCENFGSTRGPESQCFWRTNACYLRRVELSPQIILTVSVYAILLAWPLLILSGYLVQRILSHVATPNFPHINVSERGENLLALLSEDLKPNTPTLETVTVMATKSLEAEAKYVEEIRAESGYGYMNTREELVHLLRDAREQAKILSNVVAHSRTAAEKDVYLMRAFILQHLDEVSKDVLAPILLPMQLQHSPLPWWLFGCVAFMLVLYPCGLLTFIIMFGAFVSSGTTVAWVVSVLVLMGLVFGVSEFLQLICMRFFPSALLGPSVRHVCRTIHSQLRQRVTHCFKRDLDLNTMWHTNHVYRVCAGLPGTSFSTTCVLYLLGEHIIERCPFPGTIMSFWVMRYMQMLNKLSNNVYMPTHHMLVSVCACIIGTELFEHLQKAVALVLLLSCGVCCMCLCVCTGSLGGLNRFTPSNSTKQLMRRLFENESDTDYDNDNSSRGVVRATGGRVRTTRDIFEVESDEECKSCDEDTTLHVLPAHGSPRRRLVVYTHVPQTESSYPEPAPVQIQTQQLPLGQRSVMYMLSVVASMRFGIAALRGAMVESGNPSESDNSLEERPSRLGIRLSHRSPFFPLVRRRGHRQGREDRSRHGLLVSEETDTTRTSETDPVEYKRTYVYESACIYEHELHRGNPILPLQEMTKPVTEDRQDDFISDLSDENPMAGLLRSMEMSEDKVAQRPAISSPSYKQSYLHSDSSKSSSSFKSELEYAELRNMEEESAQKITKPKDSVTQSPSIFSNRRRTRSLSRTRTKSKSLVLQPEEGDENWSMNANTLQHNTSSSWSLHLEPYTHRSQPPSTLTGMDEPYSASPSSFFLPRQISNPSEHERFPLNTRPRSPSLWDDSSSECSSVHTTRGWDPSCTDLLGPRARLRKVRSFWRRSDGHASSAARLNSHTHTQTQAPPEPNSNGADVMDDTETS